MKTRDRILKAARELFNAERFGNVTTADLARACGIAEGNLWYHFKNKRALLDAISEQFLEDVEVRLAMLPSAPETLLRDYAALLIALMSEQRQYRFLYRDQADYGEHTDRLLQRLPGIYRDTHTQFQSFLHGMVKAGLLAIPPERLPDLTTNCVIILRYQLEYLRERGDDSEIGSGAVRQAIRQHLTLFETDLTPDARLQLTQALDQNLALA
ncbi:MAG: TetR/AcrR family transcriptional regulator [Pseudomonadota bacterium]